MAARGKHLSDVIESEIGRGHRRPTRLALLVAAVLSLATVVPATAAAKAPRISEEPEIAGTAQVGQTLRAEGAEWSGKPEPLVSWQWLRCDSAAWFDDDDDRDDDDSDCDLIDGATSTSYTAIVADLGKRLRVLLVVRNRDGYDWEVSAPTAKVVDAPPPPAPPPPPPPPSFEPGPSAGDTPGQALSGQPGSGPAVLGPPPAAGAVLERRAVRRPSMMRPAPVVRIRGRMSTTGARITLLTVRAPRGARITLRCQGRSCPARRWANTAAITRLLRFERTLRAGTQLVITVTKPGRIGKHTTIVIRQNRAPWRSDRCLDPGTKRPRACPGF